MSNAIGSLGDMLARIKAVLPQGWFPQSSTLQQNLVPLVTGTGQAIADSSGNLIVALEETEVPSSTPILDGLLSGVAWMFSWAYSLIEYAAAQTRIATATDVWLDIAALDFFGGNLTRNSNESDVDFSARIRANLLPPLGTRAAISAALTTLTGTAPVIFEPFNPADTGAYGYGGLGYCVAGGYGSLLLPAQAFITAFRQIEGGIPNIGGYSGNESMPEYAPGGYGYGLMQYATLSQAGTQVQDAQIYAAVAATQAAGVTCWTRIENPA